MLTFVACTVRLRGVQDDDALVHVAEDTKKHLYLGYALRFIMWRIYLCGKPRTGRYAIFNTDRGTTSDKLFQACRKNNIQLYGLANCKVYSPLKAFKHAAPPKSGTHIDDRVICDNLL